MVRPVSSFKIIDEFVKERIGLIRTGSGFIAGPKLIIHLLPINNHLLLPAINFSNFPTDTLLSSTSLGSGCNNYRYNSDGFNARSAYREEEVLLTREHTQFFRNGSVEIVMTRFFNFKNEKTMVSAYERLAMAGVSKPLKFLSNNKMGPVVIKLTLVNAMGYFIVDEDGFPAGSEKETVDRNELYLPEVSVTEADCDLPHVMKDAFDAMWNAFGLQGSCNYDKDGNWLDQKYKP